MRPADDQPQPGDLDHFDALADLDRLLTFGEFRRPLLSAELDQPDWSDLAAHRAEPAHHALHAHSDRVALGAYYFAGEPETEGEKAGERGVPPRRIRRRR